MDKLGTSPFAWLRFDEDGGIGEGDERALEALLGPDIDDLVVLAHGWKNDEADATRLYGTLWQHTCQNLPAPMPERVAVAGVLWPAKAYQTDFDEAALTAHGSVGGTLSAGTGGTSQDLPQAAFERAIADFKTFMGARSAGIEKLGRAAAARLDAAGSHALVAGGAASVRLHGVPADGELARDAGPLLKAQVVPTEAQLLLGSLLPPPRFTLRSSLGVAQGLGDQIQGVFAGPRAAVARFLNQLTYFEMKTRAGVVGRGLADAVLSKLQPNRDVRLHLVGHSFGARLVTASAEALASLGALDLFSLTLLQGAFSHNALSKVVGPGLSGAFPDVVGKPKGPITITHTHNDLACTLAYALASRLSRDTTSAIGDARDEFGAMGANGPQKLAAGLAEPDDVTQAFQPKAGKVNTILADAFVVKTAEIDAHNNVATPTVGRLLATTLLSRASKKPD